MKEPRPTSRLPLVMGLLGVVLILAVCAAFVVGLMRAQERERAGPATANATVGHWAVSVTVEPRGTFEVTMRHLEAPPSAPPTIVLSMAGMGSTPLAVRPLMNGAYGASGSLSMQGDWRLIVEDGDSTAEIPLPPAE